MQRKTPAKFKVGDWVKLSARGASERCFEPLFGKVFQIKRMEYDGNYEKNPSPYMVFQDGPECNGQLWEEFIEHDVFMNAAHIANQ